MKAFSESSNRQLSADLSNRLDRAFKDALSRGYFPGASIIVTARDNFLLEKIWGMDRTGGSPVTPSTRFDLASLTKPLVTVPLMMHAVARWIIGLDDKLPSFFGKAVPADKSDITIRHLLTHSSGLNPYRQFFFDLVNLPLEDRREAIVSMILKDPLDNPPGIAASYSDLGYILLGIILEKTLGGRLDRLAREILYEPMAAESATCASWTGQSIFFDELNFCPIDTRGGPDVLPKRVHDFDESHIKFAAAENCPWRKRVLTGEVSDENAWSLGGIAGHAGLFGTVRAVFSVVSFINAIYRGKLESRLFSPDLVRQFWTRADGPEGSTWALGFDMPRAVESSSGKYFSRSSIGHLGFTGTSFWLDLERDILIVLLANRVHPTRENDAFKKFRPVVHDIVMEALRNDL